MTQNWKPLLIVALALTAAYYLYPSIQFYGMSEAEKTTMQQNSPAALDDLHKRSINLGLDLQGGLYMILGIDFNKVYRDEIKGYARKFEYVLKDEEIKMSIGALDDSSVQDPKQTIVITDQADVERAKKVIRKSFSRYARRY